MSADTVMSSAHMTMCYEDALAVSVRLLGYGGAAAAVEEPYPGWYIALRQADLILTHGVSGKSENR